MKQKTTILFAIVVLLISSTVVTAQTKMGYIRIDDIVSRLPVIEQIKKDIQSYQTDSLGSTLTNLIADYKYKDSVFNKGDTSRMTTNVKEQYRKELAQLSYQIQNWDALAGNAVQAKQQQLLAPHYTKVYNMLKQVAKENGYTWVFNTDVLLVAPESDDLSLLVAKKMGISLQAPPNTSPPK